MRRRHGVRKRVPLIRRSSARYPGLGYTQIGSPKRLGGEFWIFDTAPGLAAQKPALCQQSRWSVLLPVTAMYWVVWARTIHGLHRAPQPPAPRYQWQA